MESSVVDVFKLLNLYEQFPCLWDYKSTQYKRIDKKKNAWSEISRNMEKDEETVKKKIKNLRSAYLLEKKKVEASKKSGFAADAVYEPHLFYFLEMAFLDNAIVQRKTSCNISNEEEIIEYSPTTMHSYESEDGLPSGSENWLKRNTSANKMKKENAEKFSCALDALITQVNNETRDNDSLFLSFGKSIGMQLARLPLALATDAMAEIQGILAKKIKINDKSDILQEAMCNSDIF